MAKLTIIHGSCADQQADVIVNAANRWLLQGGGICGVIFRKAGASELTGACQKIKTPLKDGDAVLTPSFGLTNAKAIIHAVGPDFRETPDAVSTLSKSYFNSLMVMKENGYHSISFPLISAGIFGGNLKNAPLESAKQCRIALRRFVAACPDYDATVLLCAYEDSEYQSITRGFDGITEISIVPAENDLMTQLLKNTSKKGIVDNGQKYIVDPDESRADIISLSQTQEEDMTKQPVRTEGGFIFISHSHMDIQFVRKLRNMLEEEGFEPLLFYLQSLNDEDEIENLIRREIDAREWFIYVDSENSRKSRWVQSEREYISSLSGKKVITINIDDNLSEQVFNISRNLQVFVAYTAKNRILFTRLEKALVARDFLVLDPVREIMSGDMFAAKIKQIINESALKGFCILLVTEEALKSRAFQLDIEYIIESKAKIIPVFIGEARLNEDLYKRIPVYHEFFLPSQPSDEQFDDIVIEMEKLIMNGEQEGWTG